MAHLPKEFLGRTKEQGMVVPWAPQVELLNHEAMSVFVSHGRWNSVLESASAGVPMICRPIFGDHALNAKKLKELAQEAVSTEGSSFDNFRGLLDEIVKV